MLNSLKEGVVIIDEKSRVVTFANEAAGNSTLTLYEGSRIGFDQDQEHDQANNHLST